MSLEEVKAGDKVILEGRGRLGVFTVDRTTKTQIVLSNEQKFNKKTGKLVGADAWNNDYIRIGTEEEVEKVIEKIKKANLIRKILGLDLQEALGEKDIKELANIYNILTK